MAALGALKYASFGSHVVFRAKRETNKISGNTRQEISQQHTENLAEEWEVPKALPFHLGVCLDVCGGFPLPLLQYLFIIVVYNSQVHSFCNSTFGPLSKTPAGSNLFVRQMLIN